MSARSDRFIAMMAGCSVLIAALAVSHRVWPGLFGDTASATASGANGRPREPVPVENWRQYTEAGHRVGPTDAKVTILEFADFECPACGQFAREALSAIRTRYPQDVALVFRHWPLPYHKFAYGAARAAECAAAQGHFEAMHDLLYAKQDSLGLKTFASYAQESGVPDATRFAACAVDTARVARIDADAAAAKAVGGTGTPTIIVNGLRLPGGASTERLDSLVQAALRATP